MCGFSRPSDDGRRHRRGWHARDRVRRGTPRRPAEGLGWNRRVLRRFHPKLRRRWQNDPFRGTDLGRRSGAALDPERLSFRHASVGAPAPAAPSLAKSDDGATAEPSGEPDTVAASASSPSSTPPVRSRSTNSPPRRPSSSAARREVPGPQTAPGRHQAAASSPATFPVAGSDGTSRTTTDLLVGVLLRFATLRRGTSGFVSG